MIPHKIVGKIVTLDSRDCFAIDASQIRAEHFRSMTLLAYELEQFLPLDAERMAIALGPLPGGRKAHANQGLVVVADQAPIQEKVNELESQGTWIAGVSPQFLLGAQWWADAHGVREGYIFWPDRNKEVWDVLRIENACPTHWRWMDTATALTFLRSDETQSPILFVGSVPESMHSALPGLGERVVCHEEIDIEKAASLAQEKWCNGNWKAWIDLRGVSIKTRFKYAPFYQGWLAFTAGVLLFLAASFSQILIQTFRLSDSISQNDQTTIELFSQLYPGQLAPTDIPGRLKSELRKIEMARDQISKEPPVHSSYPILVKFLNLLPDHSVFRVDAISIKSKQISSVEGAARTLSDLDAVSRALREGGFEFPPPSSTGMRDGFSVRLEQMRYVMRFLSGKDTSQQ
jgi:hypothetical protein